MNKKITKLLAMAMPIAFVIMATLTFSACGKKGSDTATNTTTNVEEDYTLALASTLPAVPTCAKPANGASKFVSKWDVSKRVGTGSKKIRPPLVQNGTYNFTVYWGDCTENTITAHDSADATHEYADAGIYTVTITGTITGWQFGVYFKSDAAKLVEISSFGPLDLGDTAGKQFYEAENLKITATDAPGLSTTKNMSDMFENATNFNSDISSWNVSAATNMQSMFLNAKAFNNGGAALSWGSGVSNVTSMYRMFEYARAFNADISSWDVSAVTNMNSMFNGAKAFNQDISGWTVSAVTNMNSMFEDAKAFNHNISSWDVSSVENMHNMFKAALAFNNGGQALSWGSGVSKVTNMQSMFSSAAAFNANISGWDVSAATNMGAMFYEATAFNQPLNDWNVGKVTAMGYMFSGATAFNQDLSGWQALLVTSTSYGCTEMFDNSPMASASKSGWYPQFGSGCP